MSINFAWNIVQLEHETQDGYVFTVHYTINAQNGTHSSNTYGSIDLKRPENELVPFGQLSEDLVISWVKEKLGEEKVIEIENALQDQLQRAPFKAAGLPWAG